MGVTMVPTGKSSSRRSNNINNSSSSSNRSSNSKSFTWWMEHSSWHDSWNTWGYSFLNNKEKTTVSLKFIEQILIRLPFITLTVKFRSRVTE